MSNDGDDLPIPRAQLAAALSFVEHASAALAGAPVLDAAARKRAVKPRVGGQMAVPAIAALVARYDLPPCVSRTDAVALVAYAASLRELLRPVALLEQRIKDEVLRAEGEAWKMTTQAFGVLEELAPAVPELASDLAEVEPWFRRARR